MDQPYVIIGNGIAGMSAAESIRERDRAAPVLILSDQECECYSRPALYYVLLGRIELADAASRPQGHYERNGFELRCGTQVRGLDPAAHTIALADGEQIRYRRLLLATGTTPRLPSWYSPGAQGFVFLNTLLDVVGIAHAAGQAKSGVVVGGGLTSVEMAEALLYAGVRPTLVMRGDGVLAGQLAPEEVAQVHRRLRQSGVELRTGTEATAVSLTEGRVSSLTTDHGETLDCQVIGIAVGILPNVALAQSAGAEVARGIIVDDAMRTALPDVYAAGDCAQLRRADGALRPPEMLWYVAQRMGRIAGANMAGGAARYQPAPFLNVAEIGGIDLCAVGEVSPGPTGAETRWAPAAREGTARLVLREGRLVGGCFVGDIRLGDVTRSLIAQRVRWDDLPRRHPLRERFEPQPPRS